MGVVLSGLSRRTKRECQTGPEDPERPTRALACHHDEGKRRVEQPGGDLAEEVDGQLVAAGHDDLIPADEQGIPREHEGQRRPGQAVMDDDEEDDCRVDHQPVGERIGDLPERGLDAPPAGEPSVDLIADPGNAEEEGRRPAMPPIRRGQHDDENWDQREPQDRERIRHMSEASRHRGSGHGSRIERAGLPTLAICSTFATDACAFPRYDQIGEEVGGTDLMERWRSG